MRADALSMVDALDDSRGSSTSPSFDSWISAMSPQSTEDDVEDGEEEAHCHGVGGDSEESVEEFHGGLCLCINGSTTSPQRVNGCGRAW